MRIRVVVVDDFGVVRDGLRLLLDAEADIETVGEAETFQEAVQTVHELQPDLVLLDLLMHERVTIDGIPALRAAAPGAAVVVTSPLDDPGHVWASFEAGASGYVLKEASADKLLDAVRAAAAGSRYLDPGLGARLALAETRHEEEDRADQLGEREREIVRLLALGHTCVEVASALGRSPRTIELYRSRIMEKLGLETRAELVRYALEHELLETDDGAQAGAHAAPIVRHPA